ncbi:hypothetical protein RCL_jg26045.t2 [Rhizophagus clarus]|uniref:Uncharacterized protein n=1 Tax=Rhizophagus clarus TaxID=94130 RepID=A0A8H3QFB6_9GLOM|nr:hypothetical protein RCL_jg26045.t2 [Rhizophagus clarus]
MYLTNGVIFIIIYLRSGPSYYHLTASYTKCTSNNCNNTSSDDLSILNRQTIDLKKITRQTGERPIRLEVSLRSLGAIICQRTANYSIYLSGLKE